MCEITNKGTCFRRCLFLLGLTGPNSNYIMLSEKVKVPLLGTIKTPSLQCSEKIFRRRFSYEDSPDSPNSFRIFPYARSSISCTESGAANSCSIAKSINDCFFRGARTGTPSFSFRTNVSKHSGQKPRCAATSIRSR